MFIRALIVDDEVLAREGLRLRLRDSPDVEIVGEAADGPSAVRMIAALKPDLVLLDVQLPVFDGLEVVRRISGEHQPLVVFVTASDRYAVSAFEAQAIDYLLKPISGERLAQAIQRARDHLAADVMLGRSRRQLMTAGPDIVLDAPGDAPGDSRGDGSGFLQRLAVKQGDRFVIVKTGEVDWIESAANYVQLHVRGKTFLLRTTMNDLEQRLDPSVFARVHRTTMVNVGRIREIIRSHNGGDPIIRLSDGGQTRISRTYRGRVFSSVNLHNMGD